MLPAAVWLLKSRGETVTAPVVSRGLEGRSPAPKVLRALERLCDIGALTELPFPGRPSARVFVKNKKSAFWDLVTEHSGDMDREMAQSSDEARREEASD